MSEKIGYARVSTREQNLSSQEDALYKAGCSRIFTDKVSGKEFNREGLTACLDYLRSGDTLVIYRLDRLGRSVKEMLDLCARPTLSVNGSPVGVMIAAAITIMTTA